MSALTLLTGSAVFLAIVAFGIWLVVQAFRGAEAVLDRETALQILEERLASGDIDREEFEERRATLLR